jgi:hypothetical protein
MRLDWMVLPVLYQKGIFLDPFKTKRGPMDDGHIRSAGLDQSCIAKYGFNLR